jgi:hypothetical protein
VPTLSVPGLVTTMRGMRSTITVPVKMDTEPPPHTRSPKKKMLSHFVNVVQTSRYEQPLVLIEVKRTGKQHFLMGKRAERFARIVYAEVSKDIPIAPMV